MAFSAQEGHVLAGNTITHFHRTGREGREYIHLTE